MDSLLIFVQDHAQYAHWVLFGLLMLAGLNLPVSEDLLVVLSGVLASNFVPENVWKLFTAVFLGAFLSDWIGYWIGRLWGKNLWKIRWFANFFPDRRLKQIEVYYKKYGILTLLFGRFIPFGVRNALFFTAGMGKISFRKFLLCDGVACLTSNAILFTLSYTFGKSGSSWMRGLQLIVLTLFLFALIGALWYKKAKKASQAE
ncbi:MAG: Inner membrane protein [Chlamydiae bacterium]|nr:Inner membrane protein [Chlamydiota bacterium]